MNITILGSCRQEALSDNPSYRVTSVKDRVSYPHYTKEILEVINFCKYGSLTPEETMFTLRTGIIDKKPIKFTQKLQEEFANSTIFVVEIASRKAYEYNNRNVHHVLYDDPKFNKNFKDKIVVREQTDEEIEQDIMKIQEELQGKMIIVGHIVSNDDKDSSRFKLVELLEGICKRHNILFINPSKEFKKANLNLNALIKNEPIIAHYNNEGKKEILKIYNKFIEAYLKDLSYLRVYQTEYNKIRLGSNGDGGYVFCDASESGRTKITYDLLISCGINNDDKFEHDFITKYPNVTCYAFDGTISKIPRHSDRIKFVKKNIGTSETNTTTDLLYLIEGHDNIFLKMDIETWEYHWIKILRDDHIKKLKQIVIEFHYPHQDTPKVDKCFNDRSWAISPNERIDCLKRLAKSHYLVHFHPNNYCKTTIYNGVTLPNVFECTFLRKDLCKNIDYSTAKIPDPILDQMNSKSVKDVTLTSYPFVNDL